MNPEQKVTSLELSRKLKEAGAKQDSQQTWVNSEFGPGKRIYLSPTLVAMHEIFRDKVIASAYDCSELMLDLLPEEIEDERGFKYQLDLFRMNGDSRFVAQYLHSLPHEGCSLPAFPEWSPDDTNPVEALGKLLLWCFENGHIKEEG